MSSHIYFRCRKFHTTSGGERKAQNLASDLREETLLQFSCATALIQNFRYNH